QCLITGNRATTDRDGNSRHRLPGSDRLDGNAASAGIAADAWVTARAARSAEGRVVRDVVIAEDGGGTSAVVGRVETTPVSETGPVLRIADRAADCSHRGIAADRGAGNLDQATGAREDSTSQRIAAVAEIGVGGVGSSGGRVVLDQAGARRG